MNFLLSILILYCFSSSSVTCFKEIAPKSLPSLPVLTLKGKVISSKRLANTSASALALASFSLRSSC